MTQLALTVDFGRGFTDAMSGVISFIPKFLAFLAILIIGWLIAKALARAAEGLLHRSGFHRIAERSGISRYLENSKYDATGIIVKIVYYALMLAVLQLSLGVFGPNPISDLLREVIAWIPKALVACVIVVVTMAIARAARDIVGNALSGTSYGRTVATVAWAFIVSVGVIAALGQAGIATSVTGPLLTAVLATAAGILIVGVGGGMIHPMRERWERWLTAAEREKANMGGVSAYQQGRADAAGQPVGGEYTTGGTRPVDEGNAGR